MSWVAVGVAGTTAVVGAVNASEQRKQQANANKQSAAISAAQQEWSPWTHMQPQEFKPGSNFGPGALGGGIQGGLGGAMFASQNKMGGFADKSPMAAGGMGGGAGGPIDTSGGQLTPEEMMQMQAQKKSIQFR